MNKLDGTLVDWCITLSGDMERRRQASADIVYQLALEDLIAQPTECFHQTLIKVSSVSESRIPDLLTSLEVSLLFDERVDSSRVYR